MDAAIKDQFQKTICLRLDWVKTISVEVDTQKVVIANIFGLKCGHGQRNWVIFPLKALFYEYNLFVSYLCLKKQCLPLVSHQLSHIVDMYTPTPRMLLTPWMVLQIAADLC